MARTVKHKFKRAFNPKIAYPEMKSGQAPPSPARYKGHKQQNTQRDQATTDVDYQINKRQIALIINKAQKKLIGPRIILSSEYRIMNKA